MNKPYLDYYMGQGISPVSQDITDLDRHFDRRESLYRSLGIAPLLVAGRSVIEFGPGSGHNAVYTASLAPRRYVLVERNPVGHQGVIQLLNAHQLMRAEYEIRQALIEEYSVEEQFDLVLCEGVIPFQLNPGDFCRHVASFAKVGGIVVITCCGAPSILGEVLRRLIYTKSVDRAAPVERQLDVLRTLFGPDLATLKGMSRPVDDWIMDNIIHPWIGQPFSIDDAIDELGPEFEVYGQSPRFVMDWRWYKALVGDEKRFNEHTRDAYFANLINFVDYRVTLPFHSPETGSRIKMICMEIYREMQILEASARPSFDTVLSRVETLLQYVEPLSAVTAVSLRAFLSTMAGDVLAVPQPGESFRSFFGRGQQYLSFIRAL